MSSEPMSDEPQRVRRRRRFPLLRCHALLFRIANDRVIEVTVFIARKSTYDEFMAREIKGPASHWSTVDYGPVRVGVRVFG